MFKIGRFVFCAFAVLSPLPSFGQAEEDTTQFSSGNAILDTSIPFSADAVEARQSLRGAFGWATYQSGSHEGIFYRFDPDGFARFSTSPRFDENVFEVTCDAATFACTAGKQGLSIGVPDGGSLLLAYDNSNLRSRFTLFDGSAETAIDLSRPTTLSFSAAEAFLSSIHLRVQNGALAPEEIDLRGVKSVYDYILWVASRQGRQPSPTEIDPNATTTQLTPINQAPTLRRLTGETVGAEPVNPDVDLSEQLVGELGRLRSVLQAQNPTAANDQIGPKPLTDGTSIAVAVAPTPSLFEQETRLLLERNLVDLKRMEAMIVDLGNTVFALGQALNSNHGSTTELDHSSAKSEPTTNMDPKAAEVLRMALELEPKQQEQLYIAMNALNLGGLHEGVSRTAPDSQRQEAQSSDEFALLKDYLRARAE